MCLMLAWLLLIFSLILIRAPFVIQSFFNHPKSLHKWYRKDVQCQISIFFFMVFRNDGEQRSEKTVFMKHYTFYIFTGNQWLVLAHLISCNLFGMMMSIIKNLFLFKEYKIKMPTDRTKIFFVFVTALLTGKYFSKIFDYKNVIPFYTVMFQLRRVCVNK